MNWIEIATVLFRGPFSYLWPLLAFPLLAAFLCDRAVQHLPPTRADWRLAAVLAAFPGSIMLVLAVVIIARSAFDFHPDDSWQHAFKHRVTPVIAFMILAQAAARAVVRSKCLRRLTRLGTPPQPRLAAAARSVGVRALELRLSDCECFVAGFWKPVVFVSHGIVSRLSEAELRAVLHHERAHAAGRDPAILAILSFLNDLVPGGSRAMDAYRQSRERSADQQAIRSEGALPLASALLAVSRSGGTRIPAMSMAGSGAGAWRLNAILRAEPAAPLPMTSVLAVAAVIAVNTAFTGWPILQDYMSQFLCICRL